MATGPLLSCMFFAALFRAACGFRTWSTLPVSSTYCTRHLTPSFLWGLWYHHFTLAAYSTCIIHIAPSTSTMHPLYPLLLAYGIAGTYLPYSYAGLWSCLPDLP